MMCNDIKRAVLLRLLLRQLPADDVRDRLEVLERLRVERLVAELDVEALLDEADQLDEDDGIEAEPLLEERHGLVDVVIRQVEIQVLHDDAFDLFKHLI
jgi:hypothetical protein